MANTIYKDIPGSNVEFILVSVAGDPQLVANIYKNRNQDNSGYYLITYNEQNNIHDIWVAGEHIAGGYGFNDETYVTNLTKISNRTQDILNLLDDEGVEITNKEIGVKDESKTIITGNTTYTLSLDKTDNKLFFKKETIPYIDITRTTIILNDSSRVKYGDLKIVPTTITNGSINVNQIKLSVFGLNSNTTQDEEDKTSKYKIKYTLYNDTNEIEVKDKDYALGDSSDIITIPIEKNIWNDIEGPINATFEFAGKTYNWKGIYFAHEIKIQGVNYLPDVASLFKPDGTLSDAPFRFHKLVNLTKESLIVEVPDSWNLLNVTIASSNLGIIFNDPTTANRYTKYVSAHKYTCEIEIIVTCQRKNTYS